MVITFNGEIYNHRELREELEAKGHVMGSRADTEVLIHGYEEWARNSCKSCAGCLPSLSGIRKINPSSAQETFSASSLLLHHCQRQSDLRIRNQGNSGAPRCQKRGQSHCTGKLSDLPVQRSGGNLLQRHFQADACALLHLQGRQNGYQTLLGACV